ncbi:hypothetical protein [Sphingopyxis sp. PET50]|uniref:hypothetical protein n=1 Tax=Sphingopyxis sp. PET50 TaxID=2976533 RepID=UPI0021AFCE3B|nr:hypothetical protein [Sphingopyxis sp. PET50]
MKRFAFFPIVALAGIAAPIATASEAPSIDSLVVCASLHGWLAQHPDVSESDRVLANREAFWFLSRAWEAAPSEQEVTAENYKRRVSERKQRAAMAAFHPDPGAEADMMQDAQKEIGSCSAVGAALVAKK